MVDRVSVLLMVYGVISAATLSGVWSRLPASSFLVVVLIDGALLLTMLSVTAFAARRFGLRREDEIAIVFCGSKKSLVTGIPMANALFPGPRRTALDRLPSAAVDDMCNACPALRACRCEAYPGSVTAAS